ncbi:MFS transporter [Roseivirga spongicola]|uniref:MFS transporter n=1 Tax=Roseivirga spongicola TaxID=333140 RepID=A0A150X619_9BACT|nr:MFS transporter [Roseivirga spongicola]KYG74189.1 MFS transporter [Roseivirga spongicola]WPZ09147.1 MFS transporter [Roseivirga spongicola]
MNNKAVKLSLYINYFVFAILLNSVGIVILKSQNVYGVDEVDASSLEAFKDFSIMFTSFLIASFLPRIGYKKGMLGALLLVTLGCILMYFGNSFWSAKLLFMLVGIGFGVVKVSVYSAIGLVTENEREHNSLMSSIEGVFMFGIALAYFLFPAFNSEADPNAWLNVYWLLAGLTLAAFFLLTRAKFDQSYDAPGAGLKEDFLEMVKLIARLLVIVFVLSAFLFVMMEQGIMTWLPTFNQKVMNLPENVAIMMSSVLMISLGIGRLAAGQLTKRFSWVSVLTVCILAAMAIVLFILPKAVNANIEAVETLADVPAIGYAFPLVGLFIAPIYPLLNSVVLSALPKKLHSPMSGLIIIFSALGGTLGSRIIGYLFRELGADQAFSYTLVPMVLLLIVIFVLKRLTDKAGAVQQA